MTTHDTRQDHEPNDDALNALLASLPQPAPSSALDAAILADAEKTLAKPVAANDSADGVLRTLPARKTPDYLQRWRIPLGLAAAVLLTVNLIGVDWFGSQPAQFPVVGEPVTQDAMPAPEPLAAEAPAPPSPSLPAVPAPRAQAKMAARPAVQAEPSAAMPPAPRPAATVPLAPPAPPPPPAPAVAMEQQAAMPAEAGLQRQAPAPRLAMPAPVAARSAPLPPPARLDASVWLVKIDALLKAGEGTLAQEEWTAFRQAYPDYPVAEELQRRLEKLQR